MVGKYDFMGKSRGVSFLMSLSKIDLCLREYSDDTLLTDYSTFTYFSFAN